MHTLRNPALPTQCLAETGVVLAAETIGNTGELQSSHCPPKKIFCEREQVLKSNSSKHGKRIIDQLIHHGPEGLADNELVEMVLYLSGACGTTKLMAKKLINEFGSFGNILAAETRLLNFVPGIKQNSIAVIKLIQAAAVRLALSEVKSSPIFSDRSAFLDYLKIVLARERIEQVRVLFLDSKNRLIADEVLWRGTINHTPVYPREILKRALELSSAAIILAHNHPSGDPTPSLDDIIMTRQVIAAARTLSIEVHDHVIVGNGTTMSFRQDGLL